MGKLIGKFDCFVFDAYGTLFDVHSAVAQLADRIGDKASALSQMWRTKQLEYTWVRSLMRQYKDFQSLTEESLDFSLQAHNIQDNHLRHDLLKAYETLSAYDEVPEVLQGLKNNNKRTAIFSNGTEKMLKTATAAAIEGWIDDIISVDELQTYKTEPATYRLVADRLGVAPEEICFQSSNRWDIAGAKSAGFHAVWINRTSAATEYSDLQPDITAENLQVLISG